MKKITYYKMKRELYRLIGKKDKINKYKAKLEAERRLLRLSQVSNSVRGGAGVTILSQSGDLYPAHALQQALREANISAEIVSSAEDCPKGGGLIFVFGAHGYSELPESERLIIVQAGPLVGHQQSSKKYIDRLKSCLAVLDYSLLNIEGLAKHGLRYPHLYFSPIGCIPKYDPYGAKEFPRESSRVKSSGVVFYGDKTAGRGANIFKLLSEKFKIVCEQGEGGLEHHRNLVNCGQVVNIHSQEGALLEAMRIYEALSLGLRVVSEVSSDQGGYSGLERVVQFVPEGDLAAIGCALQDGCDDKTSREQRDRFIIQSARRYKFYVYRLLLALERMTFESFLALTELPYVANARYCLTLPETFVRHGKVKNKPPFGSHLFDGLRHHIGWIGCGLSYKYLFTKLMEHDHRRVLICEDDVEIFSDTEERLRQVEVFLDESGVDWDIYSGMITDLNDSAKVIDVVEFGGCEYIILDQMTGLVCNIYSRRAMSILSRWDHTNTDSVNNTIDRYLESQCQLRVVVSNPFLIGHADEALSTLWGFKNTQYSDMILRTQEKLSAKVEEFKKSRE